MRLYENIESAPTLLIQVNVPDFLRELFAHIVRDAVEQIYINFFNIYNHSFIALSNSMFSSVRSNSINIQNCSYVEETPKINSLSLRTMSVK